MHHNPFYRETSAVEESRPWGSYQVLAEAPTYKVKVIHINKGHRLSLQRHRYRAEHWLVIEGDALVEIDGQKGIVSAGESADVDFGVTHRIGAPQGDVTFIEIQTGSSFSEDDIERLEDDYNR